MANPLKQLTYSILCVFMFLAMPCFAQLAHSLAHPFDGSGEGLMLVEEDGRVFIYLNLQTTADSNKRILVITPREPASTLDVIPDVEGSFVVKPVLNKSRRVQGFTVKWASLSDPAATANYYFSLRDTPAAPADDLGTIVEVYMVQGATRSDEYLTEILNEFEEYDAEQLDDIWIAALLETDEHGFEPAVSGKYNNCDSGGPGSIGCFIGDVGVICGAGYYACCKDNTVFEDTAVCCPVAKKKE